MTTQVNLGQVWASGGGSIDPGAAKYSLGWVVEIPTYENFNYVLKGLDTNVLALAEAGDFSWQADIVYKVGARVTVANTVYVCHLGNTNISPTSDTTGSYWSKGMHLGGPIEDSLTSQGLFVGNIKGKTDDTWGSSEVTIQNSSALIALNTSGVLEKNFVLGNVKGKVVIADVGTLEVPDGRSIIDGATGVNEIYHRGNLAPAEILTQLKTVDGAGSGLDADYLGGLVSGKFDAVRASLGVVDLNDYISTGKYTQGSTSNASAGTNFPVALAGLLEVTDAGGMRYQRYTQYSTPNTVFVRCKYINTWSPWSKMWNTINGGSGSGLDADTVDGYHVNAGVGSWAATINKIPIVQSNGVMEIGRFIDFHTSNSTVDYDVRIDCDTANTMNITGINNDNGLRINGNEVWHAGNDGSGSGLSADNLDGYGLSSLATGSTLALRNSAGDIDARLFKSNYVEQGTPGSTADICFRNNNTSDNYLRFTNRDGLINYLNMTGSKSTAGYQRFSSGIILQWGRLSTNYNWNTRINFPTVFPSACQAVMLTYDAQTSGTSGIYRERCGVKYRTQTGFYGGGDNLGHTLTYLAIGY